MATEDGSMSPQLHHGTLISTHSPSDRTGSIIPNIQRTFGRVQELHSVIGSVRIGGGELRPMEIC